MANVIGFIGAGQLGEPMVSRLLGAGHDVLVYARRPEVRESVTSQGATVADSVADLARQSDILISCLFSDAQLNEAGLGPDGFITNAKPGSIFVSHTTGTVATLTALRDSDPSPPVILDAPVSGTVDNIVARYLDGVTRRTERCGAAGHARRRRICRSDRSNGRTRQRAGHEARQQPVVSCNAQLLAAAMQLGKALGVDDAALLSALQVCSSASHAAAQAHRVGGIENFTERATPFLRKDIAAASEAAGEAGVDLGLLGMVVAAGPLDL